MPVLIAAAAMILSLVLTGSAWAGPLPPGAPWFFIVALVGMCVASALLRGRHRLFLVVAWLYGANALLAAATLLIWPNNFEFSLAALQSFAVMSALGVVAQVLFLIGMSAISSEDDLLRVAFLVVAGCAALTGAWQVIVNFASLFESTTRLVFDAAMAIGTSPLGYVPLLINAATPLLLVVAWLRLFRRQPIEGSVEDAA